MLWFMSVEELVFPLCMGKNFNDRVSEDKCCKHISDKSVKIHKGTVV